MPSEPILDTAEIDFSTPLFTIEDIREINPQRDAMEQLTAIVHVDEENHVIVGYKEVTDQEFWVTGHMPGFPLMLATIHRRVLFVSNEKTKR